MQSSIKQINDPSFTKINVSDVKNETDKNLTLNIVHPVVPDIWLLRKSKVSSESKGASNERPCIVGFEIALES